MQHLTHVMENVFSEIRNGKMKATSELVDVLFKGLDILESYLAAIQADGTEGNLDSEDIINALNNILNTGLGVADPDSGPSKSLAGEITMVPPSENEKEKFRYLKLEEHEKKAIAKALSLDLNVIGLTIYIQEYCVLKGARAFMVNRTLEEHGEIIKLDPSAQDLEDEKYDFDYSAFLITKETPENIINYAMSVSEVKEVVADYIRLSKDELDTYLNAIKQEEALISSPKPAVEPGSLKWWCRTCQTNNSL